MSFPYRYSQRGEVSGAAISAIYHHYQGEEVIESFAPHPMTSLDAESWYGIDQFIDLLADHVHEANFNSDMIQMGTHMAAALAFFGQGTGANVLDKLMALGDMHMAHHRGGSPGGYHVTHLSEKHLRYEENTVWPDDFIYGYLFAAAQRYLPEGTRFTVCYDAQHSHQEQGGTSTVFHLLWE